MRTNLQNLFKEPETSQNDISKTDVIFKGFKLFLQIYELFCFFKQDFTLDNRK